MRSMSLATALVCVVTVAASAQIAPYTENFDGATSGSGSCVLASAGVYPAGWTDGGGTGAWCVDANGTGSSGTGPSGDHTSGAGNYMYCETSGSCTGGEFLLVSPMVDVSTLANPTVSFWAHMLGSATGVLEMQETDGLGGWNTRWVQIGEVGPDWFRVELPLVNTGMTQVRFRYTGSTSFTADTAIDDVSFDEPTPPAPPLPEFQSNSAESSALINGGAAANVCDGDTVTIDLSTTLTGNLFDVLINFGDPVGRSAGAINTAGDQLINVPLYFPTLLQLYQYGTGAAGVHPGSLALVFNSPPGADACAQQYVTNPAQLDGVSLSQPISLDSGPAGIGPFPGPTGDDSSVLVTLSGSPLCGAPVPFCGTMFDQLHVNSNGHLTFGGNDTDFSPSISDAIGDRARFGVWTDLNPSAGGSIDYDFAGNTFTANFQANYFGESVGPSFSLSIDTAGVCTIDVSGYVANPLTSTSSSDAVFLGLSSGLLLGATDAGPTVFAPAGSGSNALPTDMIYDFADGVALSTAIVPGQINSISLLQGGSGQLIFTPGATPGTYTWMGL